MHRLVKDFAIDFIFISEKKIKSSFSFLKMNSLLKSFPDERIMTNFPWRYLYPTLHVFQTTCSQGMP